jgi:hypothetical protein
MGKKQKKMASRKSRGRKRSQVYYTAKSLNLSTFLVLDINSNNGRVTSTKEGLPVEFQSYFRAHPTKTSATIGEIADYLRANTKSTRNDLWIDSEEKLLHAVFLPPPSRESDHNHIQNSSVESEQPVPSSEVGDSPQPPSFGERILLLILTKEERVNIPGDLEEEFKQITAKHGERYAKLWYYKQVAASAWPLIRKVVKLGLITWVEEWIRRWA